MSALDRGRWHSTSSNLEYSCRRRAAGDRAMARLPDLRRWWRLGAFRATEASYFLAPLPLLRSFDVVHWGRAWPGRMIFLRMGAWAATPR